MKINCTINELIACILARDIKDGEKIGAGANIIVPRAAMLLAHLHHGPNMRLFMPIGAWVNVFNIPVIQVYGTADSRPYQWAEYSRRHEEALEKSLTKKGGLDVFFLGAIEIDKYGNMNMFGVGDNFGRLKFRAPGIIGNSYASTYMKRFYIYSADHNRRRFVEKLNYVSAVGYGDGPDFRKRYNLPGEGPKWCITPLAIMDFDEETKKMRLKSVHPGVTVDQVVENTGFELIIPKDVLITELPTDEELQILRTRVDPRGLLKK